MESNSIDLIKKLSELDKKMQEIDKLSISVRLVINEIFWDIRNSFKNRKEHARGQYVVEES